MNAARGGQGVRSEWVAHQGRSRLTEAVEVSSVSSSLIFLRNDGTLRGAVPLPAAPKSDNAADLAKETRCTASHHTLQFLPGLFAARSLARTTLPSTLVQTTGVSILGTYAARPNHPLLYAHVSR